MVMLSLFLVYTDEHCSLVLYSPSLVLGPALPRITNAAVIRLINRAVATAATVPSLN